MNQKDQKGSHLNISHFTKEFIMLSKKRKQPASKAESRVFATFLT